MLFKIYRTDYVDYDETAGMVVRASGELHALQIAGWVGRENVACEALEPNGEPEIILEDFRAG